MYMLNLAFAQSKYYTDNLSENIRRGINSKLKRGVFPNCAKRGYINHSKTKEVIPDPETFHLVKELFEMYATGKYSFAYLGEMFYEKGLHNNSGGVLSGAQVQRMMKDPFYYGHFKFVGEIYEGIHQPCISKELFDKAQVVMKNKGKAKTRKADNHAFLGLMTCDECGCSITAEEQRGHVYYRCSRKSRKVEKCTQPYLREESLVAQLTDLMNQVTLPIDWLNHLLIEIDTISGSLESRANGQFLKIDSQTQDIQARISRLADLYIENDLSRAEYLARKEKLLSEKVALLERRRKIVNMTENRRLEQMRKPLELLQDWISCASGVDHKKLRDLVTEVGSNMKLNSRELLWNWISPYCILASRGVYSTWRRGGDSNPRYVSAHTLSRRAPSATRSPLQGAGLVNISHPSGF
jgi:site-specific DNA recombinase